MVSYLKVCRLWNYKPISQPLNGWLWFSRNLGSELGWASLRYNDITHWAQSWSHFLYVWSCETKKNYLVFVFLDCQFLEIYYSFFILIFGLAPPPSPFHLFYGPVTWAVVSTIVMLMFCHHNINFTIYFLPQLIFNNVCSL